MTLGLADVPDNVVAIVSVIVLFVVSPLVFSYARVLWKRASDPRPRVPDETAHLLKQMQQSIDAMAIEIERISEGQRFVTKVLNDRKEEGGRRKELTP